MQVALHRSVLMAQFSFARIDHFDMFVLDILSYKVFILSCLPDNSRPPDRLLLDFPFRKFPTGWWMNRSGRRCRLPLFQRFRVGGSRRCGSTLVLLFDPGDLVVFAGLPRHRGRYFSHLYLRVRKSVMAAMDRENSACVRKSAQCDAILSENPRTCACKCDLMARTRQVSR